MPQNKSFKNKPDTYGRALLFDLDYFANLANLTDVRKYILELREKGFSTEKVNDALEAKFNIRYDLNYLSDLESVTIPKEIANAATKRRLLLETPQSECKQCFRCKRWVPKHPLFLARNSGRRDGWSSNCKECERLRRIERKKVNLIDARRKDKNLPSMPNQETPS